MFHTIPPRKHVLVALSFAAVAILVPTRADALYGLGPMPGGEGGGNGSSLCVPVSNVGAAGLTGLLYGGRRALMADSDPKTAWTIGGGLGRRTADTFLETRQDGVPPAEARRQRLRESGEFAAARFGSRARTSQTDDRLAVSSRWNNVTSLGSCRAIETYSSLEELVEVSLARPGSSSWFLELGPELAAYGSARGHSKTFLWGAGLVAGSGVLVGGEGPAFLARGGSKFEFLMNEVTPLYRAYGEVGMQLPRSAYDWELSLRGTLGHTRTFYDDREWVTKPVLTANVGLAD